MHDAAALEAPNRKPPFKPVAFVRANFPTLADSSLAIASALLLVVSFPDFNLWWLAWMGLVPLMVVIARTPMVGRAFILGWLWGTIFFYGTCWWLTYPMIHYGRLHAWLAYPLLLLPVMLVALFPGMACFLISRLISRFGLVAMFTAPVIWVSFEWLRYAVTGQLWNAFGYSQAFHPLLIQTARWGGVYAVSFLITLTNSAIAIVLIRRRFLLSLACLSLVAVILILSSGLLGERTVVRRYMPAASAASVIAIQPNVPMDLAGDTAEMNELLERHLSLSRNAFQALQSSYLSGDLLPQLVIWPESPMNFSYSRDPKLRETVEAFARQNHTSVLLNSLEPARNGGEHNSAIMINEDGRIVAQYDKIRLMPFGEYVPLPQWLPGASSVRGIVGEFTPGNSYTLMPLGAFRAGVFICIEAAHPGIARSFTNAGADVLINISNDGYLGPTPVMRQHLANAVFRAVENERPLVRVTNSGISALISRAGEVGDSTAGFEPTVRSWIITGERSGTTFYTRHGDIFAYACALISLGIVSASFRGKESEARA